MYNELYEAWRREIEETPLGGLPRDFYGRIAEYLKRLSEEDKVLDKKSVKVNLLDHEAQNVKRMLDELLRVRYKKLIKTITQNQQLPSELLTVEEAQMSESFATFSGAYQKFAKSLMQGQTTIQTASPTTAHTTTQTITAKVETPVSHKRMTLRFTKNTPAIIVLRHEILRAIYG